MKARYILILVLFASLSTTLFAQAMPQRFPQVESLLNRHQQRSDANHEYDIFQKDYMEPVDEYHGQRLNPNAIIPVGTPLRNVQISTELQYFCDSCFSYRFNGEIIKTTNTRNGVGKVIVEIRQGKVSEYAAWVNMNQYLYTYDASGNILTREFQYWENGIDEWRKHTRYSLIYDATGNMISRLSQSWNEYINDWHTTVKINYTYDVSGNKISSLSQFWLEGIGGWRNSDQSFFSFNAIGKLISHIHQLWDNRRYCWVNERGITYTYDSSGKQLSWLIQKWDSGNSNWADSSKTNFSYDVEGKILSSLAQKYDNENSIWINSRKDNYSYNISGSMLSEFTQVWNAGNGNWVNYAKTIKNYDAFENMLSLHCQNWQFDIDDWVNDFKIDYEFNYNLKKVTGLFFVWSGGWFPAEQDFDLYLYNNLLYNGLAYHFKAEAYYSSFITGIDDNKELYGKTSFCSPNPANERVNVTNLFEKEARLTIYNINGQLLHEKLLIKGRNLISVQNLSPGIYVFVMQSENIRIQNKVVVY